LNKTKISIRANQEPLALRADKKSAAKKTEDYNEEDYEEAFLAYQERKQEEQIRIERNFDTARELRGY
jgi:hypothetical protein